MIYDTLHKFHQLLIHDDSTKLSVTLDFVNFILLGFYLDFKTLRDCLAFQAYPALFNQCWNSLRFALNPLNLLIKK